jgi:hypothetical protein
MLTVFFTTGKFQSLATLAITTNAMDAYKLVLVDTPLAGPRLVKHVSS